MQNSKAPKIVLMEDNPADVKLVRMALQGAGLDCSLRVIDDGNQALAFIEALDVKPGAVSIDLLLLDMHLPKHDGEDILKRLRSLEHCAQTPVVIMTASDAPEDHNLAQKHAAMYYFRKTASLDQFMQLGMIVRDILARMRPAATESGGVSREFGGTA